MTRFIIDAYAWIEYLEGSDKGRKVTKIIEGERNDVFTSSATLAEITSKFLRTNKDPKIALIAINNISSIMIYPSIATDNIYIRSKLEINKSLIELSSCSGQIVKSLTVDDLGQVFESSLNVSDLVPGFYFVRIVNDDIVYVGKFVKQ